MNSYRIDTFEMEDGSWKAAAYKCGAYIAERTGSDEGTAIILVAAAMAVRING